MALLTGCQRKTSAGAAKRLTVATCWSTWPLGPVRPFGLLAWQDSGTRLAHELRSRQLGCAGLVGAIPAHAAVQMVRAAAEAVDREAAAVSSELAAVIEANGKPRA
jgi:hypothetical protein